LETGREYPGELTADLAVAVPSAALLSVTLRARGALSLSWYHTVSCCYMAPFSVPLFLQRINLGEKNKTKHRTATMKGIPSSTTEETWVQPPSG